MSNKLCFNKNIFVSGIIILIIIIIILSVFFNFKYKENNNEMIINNLINKKILNIKDKIIKKKHELEPEKNYELEPEKNYELEPEKNFKFELEPEKNFKFELEPEKNFKFELEPEKNFKFELEQELENKYKLKVEKELENKYKLKVEKELEKELEENIIVNTKVNFKNNINDRLNDRDELIKYKINDEVQQRDLNVLLNPIYPPLARVERPIFDNLIKMNFQQSTRGSEDTFRLMAYLINSNKNDSDTGGDVWKLFGRQTYRGSGMGEFYVSPVNDHQSDMKIFLKNNMMPKEKIKDIYALPSEVYLESPFFSKNAYTINELPKSDFNSNYL
jgi:hypothetical protein